MSHKSVTNPDDYAKFTKEGAERYAAKVQSVFAPIYPILARLVIQRSGIHSGVCIDIGSGTAALAIAIARISDMTVYAVDHADEIQNIAEQSIIDEQMEERVKICSADVHTLPFENNFAHMIISRGSVMFWKDAEKAFNEIYRVLKPKGYACIGSGSGTREAWETVQKNMIRKNPDFSQQSKKRMNPEVQKRLETAITFSKVPHHTIIRDESGFWITFSK